MQIHNLHALDPQALSCIPPQQFSRLLDRVNAIQGANAADRLMARYSRARKDSAADQPRDREEHRGGSRFGIHRVRDG